MIRSPIVPLGVIAVAFACHSEATSPKPADFVVGVYDEYSRDSSNIPFVASQDAHCTTVNHGGWLSLEAGGTYTLELDQVTTMCDSTGNVTFGWAQKGTYVRSGNDLTLTAYPDEGGGWMYATFDSGTYQRTPTGGGGQLPSITLDDHGVHQYVLLNNGIAALRAF